MPRSMLREVASRMPISIARKRIQKQDHANTRHVCSYKRSLRRVPPPLSLSLSLSLSLTSFQIFPKFSKLKLRDTQRRLYLSVDHLTVRFIFRVNGCAFVTQRGENRCAKPLVRLTKWTFQRRSWSRVNRNDRFFEISTIVRVKVWISEMSSINFFKIDGKMNKEVQMNKARASRKIFPFILNFSLEISQILDNGLSMISMNFSPLFLHRFTIDFSDSCSDSWGSGIEGNITQR